MLLPRVGVADRRPAVPLFAAPDTLRERLGDLPRCGSLIQGQEDTQLSSAVSTRSTHSYLVPALITRRDDTRETTRDSVVQRAE